MSAAIASLTQSATAKVVECEVTVNVAGMQPAVVPRTGESFTPDRVTVITRHSSGQYGTYTYAALSGAFLGVRGGRGMAFFMLAGQTAIDAPQAPQWLSALLTNAGVTW